MKMRSCYRPAVCGAILLGLFMTAPRASAGPWFGQIEFLTFRAPVGLPGVTLVAGAYSFEIAHLNGSDVVRVRYRRTNRLTFEGVTHRVERPKGLRLRDSVILGEAGPGEVAPIVAWFPIGERIGYQFVYPTR